MPIYSPTTPGDPVSELAELLASRQLPDVASDFVALRELSNRPTFARIRFCGSCFHEQVAKYGVAYYRRAWSIPYVFNCTKHREKLKGIACPVCGENDTFGDLQRNFEQFCPVCGTDLWFQQSESSNEQSLLIDSWFEQLLTSNLSFLSLKDRYRCLKEADHRLKESSFSELLDHRCNGDCDRHSCAHRVRWMKIDSNSIGIRSYTQPYAHNHYHYDVPPFLLFWLPLIFSFGSIDVLRGFLLERN